MKYRKLLGGLTHFIIVIVVVKKKKIKMKTATATKVRVTGLLIQYLSLRQLLKMPQSIFLMIKGTIMSSPMLRMLQELTQYIMIQRL